VFSDKIFIFFCYWSPFEPYGHEVQHVEI